MDSRSETPSANELLAHAAFVRWLAYDLVGNQAEAEDVAQETMLLALRKPPAILTSMKSWLAGVTRNVVRMRRRTEGRRVAREQVAARGEALPGAADSAATMETFRLLTQAVDDLGEPNRTMVLLRYYEGMKPGEIATKLSIPVQTVKSRLHRSLGHLRARLDERHGDRRAWTALLLPLAKAPTLIGTAPVVSGAIVMSMKTKIGAVVATVLLLATVGIFLADPFAGPPPPAPKPIELAGLPDEPPEPAPTSAITVDLSPARSEPAVAPGAASLRVRVVDAETGMPLDRVAVFHHDVSEDYVVQPDDDESMVVEDIIGDSERTRGMVTNSDGRAALETEPGPKVMVIRHPGYLDFLGERFALGDGEARETTIRLVPYPPDERVVLIEGTVTDAQTGLPLAGVRVDCWYFPSHGLRKGLSGTPTGADGRFQHRVPVNAPVRLRYQLEGYELLERSYNPVHQDWLTGDGAMLPVGSGPKRGEARITGSITDAATGKPIAEVALVLLRDIGLWSGFKGDRNGKYRIDTPVAGGAEEQLRIGIGHDGYEPWRSEPITIAPDRTVTFDIALVRAASGPGLAGRVVDERTGDAVPGARVGTYDAFGDSVSGTTSAADGSFGLGIRGRESEFRVSAKGYRRFSIDIRRDLATKADSLRSMTVRLRPTDARIIGRVTDAATGKPLEGVTVSRFFEPEWSGPRGVSVTDAAGIFSFDVAEGRFAFRAVLSGYGAGCSQPTAVAAKGTATADIVLHALDCVVTGRVRDAVTGDELPKHAGSVGFYRLPNDGEEESICNLTSFGSSPDLTAADGIYTARLIPGRYEIVLSVKGYERFEQTATIRKGERLEFDLTVTPMN